MILIHINSHVKQEIPAYNRIKGFTDICKEHNMKYRLFLEDLGNTYDETKYPIIAKIDHEIPWVPYNYGYAKIDIFNKNYLSKIPKKSITTQGITSTFDGEKLTINNTKLNLSTVYQNYQYITSNFLWLNSFIEEYKTNGGKIYEENQMIIMEVSSKNSNPYNSLKKLFILFPIILGSKCCLPIFLAFIAFCFFSSIFLRTLVIS